MKKLLIILLLSTSPTLADSTLLGSEDINQFGRQLSQIDTAYRQGCISRRERDRVWDEAENLASMVGMDWQRIHRVGKSVRYNSVKCATARGIVRNVYVFSNTPE